MSNIVNIGSSSSGNCFVINEGTVTIIFDLGFNYKDLQKRYQNLTRGKYLGAPRVAAALISHRHQDHSKGAAEFARSGGAVYVPKTMADRNYKTADPAKAVINEKFAFACFPVIHYHLGDDMKPGESKEYYEKTYQIECLGYIAAFHETGNIWLYMTDTAFILPPLENVTHAIIECNHDLELLSEENCELHVQRGLGSHLSVQDLLNILKNSDTRKLRKLYLSHNSVSNLDKLKAKKMIREVFKGEIIFCKKNGGFDEI